MLFVVLCKCYDSIRYQAKSKLAFYYVYSLQFFPNKHTEGLMTKGIINNKFLKDQEQQILDFLFIQHNYQNILLETNMLSLLDLGLYKSLHL